MISLNINSGAQLMYQFSDISLIEDILSALFHVLIFFLKSKMQKKDKFKFRSLFIGFKI